jgi:estrogen-related receptor beta like 1
LIEYQEEDEILHIDELSAIKGTALGSSMPQRPEEILQSNTDAEIWHLEVERVAPQLKVTVRVDARDWRTHLEQVKS